MTAYDAMRSILIHDDQQASVEVPRLVVRLALVTESQAAGMLTWPRVNLSLDVLHYIGSDNFPQRTRAFASRFREGRNALLRE